MFCKVDYHGQFRKCLNSGMICLKGATPRPKGA
jgi:hypothetical protein